MVYTLVIKPSAKKFLDKLNTVERTKIVIALDHIVNNPWVGKKLVGELIGLYSFRTWPFRIIYQIFKHELVIVVIKIGQRQGVYKI